MMTAPPIIETPRALLTVLSPLYAHLHLDYQLRNKEHLAQWEPLREDEFFTVNASQLRAENAIFQFVFGSTIQFIAFNRDFTKVIAVCFFTNIVKGPVLSCDFSCSISKELEGIGLMQEIAAAGIQFMFDDIGLHRIEATYMPTNLRSKALLKRLGFEDEGYAKSYAKILGKWEDMITCALLNSKI